MKVERSENIGEFEELCESHPYINKPTENREDRDFFVLKNNKDRVGCAYIRSFFKKIGTIGAVFVKECWRREGFGSFLIEKLEGDRIGGMGFGLSLLEFRRITRLGLSFGRIRIMRF